ncbi:MAG TPA: hypothetical protein K8W20_12260 [Pseudomonas lactis]|uniref:Uncharacterized protein n=1 Tax=Pseudomonas lactis TaxID=1615674 RepID=A0A921NI60_9PSED|nr:hypothetical protein [Pseudomonas lactis]HJH19475.1 hypothetical protein [Pseudomonas lactis]
MFNDPISPVMFFAGVVGLIWCYHSWRAFERKCAEERRQWILDVNNLGERYGHPELVGTPDNPDAAYIKCYEAGQTPAQVIASVFGAQQPTC